MIYKYTDEANLLTYLDFDYWMLLIFWKKFNLLSRFNIINEAFFGQKLFIDASLLQRNVMNERERISPQLHKVLNFVTTPIYCCRHVLGFHLQQRNKND